MSEIITPFTKLIGPDDTGHIDEDMVEFSDVEVGDNFTAQVAFSRLPYSTRAESGRVLHLSENTMEDISKAEACERELSRVWPMALITGQNIRQPLVVDISLDGKTVKANLLMHNTTHPESVDVVSEFAPQLWKSPEFPSTVFDSLCVKYDFNDMTLIRNMQAKFQIGGDVNL